MLSAEGGGRGRNLQAHLNLVPFIDLLSTCITFLLATAVWTQNSTLLVDQSIQDPNAEPPPPPDTPPVPPLTMHIRSDGVWLGRSVETGKNFPALTDNDSYDWMGVEEAIQSERDAQPEESQVVIVTDDGVSYRHMIKALDLSRAHGFDKTLLGGGPASTNVQISVTPTPAPG